MSLVVATLVIAFATPARADYYVAFDLASGTCVIMNTQPRAWASTALRPKPRRLLHLAGGAIGARSIAEDLATKCELAMLCAKLRKEDAQCMTAVLEAGLMRLVEAWSIVA
jgi:hypothetical protein